MLVAGLDVVVGVFVAVRFRDAPGAVAAGVGVLVPEVLDGLFDPRRRRPSSLPTRSRPAAGVVVPDGDRDGTVAGPRGARRLRDRWRLVVRGRLRPAEDMTAPWPSIIRPSRRRSLAE